MRSTGKRRTPLPRTFPSEEAVGEFWDTHSTADYEDSLLPAEVTIDLKERHFVIEVDRDTFFALTACARKRRRPVKVIASRILKEKLVSAKVS